jgi:two-component sensor histidine kinase
MAVALKEQRPVRGAEAVAERPDGSLIPFIPYPTPLFDPAGQMTGAVNVLVDIGHRKEAETRQRLLFAELNHRIKNNMQMLYALLAAARRETAATTRAGRSTRRRGGWRRWRRRRPRSTSRTISAASTARLS